MTGGPNKKAISKQSCAINLAIAGTGGLAIYPQAPIPSYPPAANYGETGTQGVSQPCVIHDCMIKGTFAPFGTVYSATPLQYAWQVIAVNDGTVPPTWNFDTGYVPTETCRPPERQLLFGKGLMVWSPQNAAGYYGSDGLHNFEQKSKARRKLQRFDWVALQVTTTNSNIGFYVTATIQFFIDF
jgi:hypothetical protein